MQEQGTISVNTENIFPIIKKFLYSDHEIFLRELVSNAVDASLKLQRLASLGEFTGELGDLKVSVTLNAEAKTITVSDNGVGMTSEEIKKYINQIAFSGAAEFVEKYKDKSDGKDIIGHFGMGFYSAFMVAHKVDIITQSYQPNTESALWSCDGSTSFSIEKTVKETRGTEIVLHVSEDSEEFLDAQRLRGILRKYARFLPIAVELEGELINSTLPIWTKSPSELTDEDYKKFYKELYPNSPDPLFWIHLNVDYPFNLTGILYFPQIGSSHDLYREKIQLYSRQVFITDEVKDVVPDFLMLLHGVIDSPDIPLNVSRSFLQADGNVKKINGYITKKVADKLSDIFKADRVEFDKKWDDIGLFIKYGFLADEKFQEKAKAFCLLKNTDKQAFTFDEYREKVQAIQTDKNQNVIYLYTSDAQKQNTYIQSAKKKGYDVLILDHPMIDQHFIGSLERVLEKTQLKRVDADTVDKLIDTGVESTHVLSEAESAKIKEMVEKVLNNTNMTVEVKSLPTDEMPIVITFPEFMRRMQEMAKTQGFSAFMNPNPQLNVGINANHTLTQKILQLKDEAQQTLLIKQAYDLALLSQNMLGGESLTQFIERSVELIGA